MSGRLFSASFGPPGTSFVIHEDVQCLVVGPASEAPSYIVNSPSLGDKPFILTVGGPFIGQKCSGSADLVLRAPIIITPFYACQITAITSVGAPKNYSAEILYYNKLPDFIPTRRANARFQGTTDGSQQGKGYWMMGRTSCRIYATNLSLVNQNLNVDYYCLTVDANFFASDQNVAITIPGQTSHFFSLNWGNGNFPPAADSIRISSISTQINYIIEGWD